MRQCTSISILLILTLSLSGCCSMVPQKCVDKRCKPAAVVPKPPPLEKPNLQLLKLSKEDIDKMSKEDVAKLVSVIMADFAAVYTSWREAWVIVEMYREIAKEQ